MRRVWENNTASIEPRISDCHKAAGTKAKMWDVVLLMVWTFSQQWQDGNDDIYSTKYYGRRNIRD